MIKETEQKLHLSEALRVTEREEKCKDSSSCK